MGPLADTVIGYLPPRVNPRRDSTQVPVLVRLFTTGLARPNAGDRLTRVPVTTPVLVIEFDWPRVMVLSPEMGNAEVGVMTVTRAGLTDRVGADPVAEPCLAVPLALIPATIHATGLPTAPRGNPGEETTLATHPSTPLDGKIGTNRPHAIERGHSAQVHLSQHSGVVVLPVAGRVDQGERAGSRPPAKALERKFAADDLATVPRPKLLEA